MKKPSDYTLGEIGTLIKLNPNETADFSLDVLWRLVEAHEKEMATYIVRPPAPIYTEAKEAAPRKPRNQYMDLMTECTVVRENSGGENYHGNGH